MDQMLMAGTILFTALQAGAPFDTGNLAINGIAMKSDGSEIYIGGENAPYAIFTEYPWDNFGGNLEGKQNPNEGWIERCIENAKPMLIQALSGQITQRDLSGLLKPYQTDIQKRAEHLAEVIRRRAAAI